MDMLQTVATCTAVAFFGTASGRWTWVRFAKRLRPSAGDCIAYGMTNAYTAAWASALAIALFKA